MEERWARRGAFGRLSSAIDREPEGGDLSFGEAARRYAPELRDAAGNLTLLSLGEEADRVSIRDYQRLDSGEDYVVPAGYGHLLGRYAKGLDLQLGTPVEAIDLSGDGVMLTTAKGTLRARAAIVTCSVGVLQRETIRFRPGLPAATLAALEGLRMGALTKVALHLTGERFGLTPWTQYFDVGSRPTAEPGADLINFEFWPFGRDLVIAFLGGDYARELAKAGEAAAVAAVRSRLTAILGPKVDTAFRGGRLAGWSADPLALGSYSVALPGRAAAREALAEPVAGRLVFAGEASAGSGSMTAGGAALAAQKAVDDLAVRLAVPVK